MFRSKSIEVKWIVAVLVTCAIPALPAFSQDQPEIKLDLHVVIHADFVAFDRGEDNLGAAGSQETDFPIKRARLIMGGKLGDVIAFKTQTGFELNGPALMDAVIIITPAPWIEFRAGQMKVPYSQERLRAYSRQPFMERSLAGNLALRRSNGGYLDLKPAPGASLQLGIFTGETMNAKNTDDALEYTGRVVLEFHDLIDGFPGQAQLAGGAAWGYRSPERASTNSFRGRTLNQVVFFSPVPVHGYRERYEVDADWRVGPVWIGGEWVVANEDRDSVTVDLDTNGDRVRDDQVVRDLNPLIEEGWMVNLLVMLTGEDASDRVEPASEWGALAAATRSATHPKSSAENRSTRPRATSTSGSTTTSDPAPSSSSPPSGNGSTARHHTKTPTCRTLTTASGWEWFFRI